VPISHADARDLLKYIEPESVDCCVTSPPYWGLRDYGIGEDALGLEPTPELYIAHLVEIFREVRKALKLHGTLWLNLGDSYAGSNKGVMSDGSQVGGSKHLTNVGSVSGLQKTEVPVGLKPLDLCMLPARVALALQADGWYLRSVIIWAKPNPMPESCQGWRWEREKVKVTPGRVPRHGIERGVGHVNESNVAEREDGAEYRYTDRWLLRHGSGRPTTAHEYIFLLAKTNDYYFDTEAVRIPFAEATINRANYPFYPDDPRSLRFAEENKGLVGRTAQEFNAEKYAKIRDGDRSGANIRSVWEMTTQPFGYEWCRACKTLYGSGEYRRLKIYEWIDDDGKKHQERICRCGEHNSWLSHFATFPESLPERCIKAGTSEWGVCPKCGKPWVRMVENPQIPPELRNRDVNKMAYHTRETGGGQRLQNWRDENPSTTLGWRPSCDCDAGGPIPARVLDPFAGSATTCLVAQKLGRDYIGLDVNEDYVLMSQAIMEREGAPLFASSTDNQQPARRQEAL